MKCVTKFCFMWQRFKKVCILTSVFINFCVCNSYKYMNHLISTYQKFIVILKICLLTLKYNLVSFLVNAFNSERNISCKLIPWHDKENEMKLLLMLHIMRTGDGTWCLNQKILLSKYKHKIDIITELEFICCSKVKSILFWKLEGQNSELSKLVRNIF